VLQIASACAMYSAFVSGSALVCVPNWVTVFVPPPPHPAIARPATTAIAPTSRATGSPEEESPTGLAASGLTSIGLRRPRRLLPGISRFISVLFGEGCRRREMSVAGDPA